MGQDLETGHNGIPGQQGGSAPNFRSFSSATEANIYALENLSPKTPLTEDEENAIYQYVGTEFIGINGGLRKSGEETEVVLALDSAIDKAGYIQEPITVVRSFGVTFFKDKQVGDVFEDKGFTSTSIDPNYGGKFSAKILVPKYARGLYVKPYGMEEEYEVLFARNSRFEIIQKDAKGIVLRML